MGVQSQIGGSQREVNPASEQSNPAVTRPRQQVVAQQFPDECENGWIGGGMKTMAAVVDLDAGELETACVAADAIGLLENGDRVSLTRQSERSAETRGSGAENGDA